MRRQSLRESLVLSLLLTAGWGVVLQFTESDPDPLSIVQTLLFFFVIILGTMRIANLVLTRIFPPKAPPPPPPPTPPKSERRAHAMRRRGRRRRRPRG
ncbi:MAG: hypothetical protein OXC94_01500 [Chloroflexi bacterium]|nr:hypothetical protein [Chloroflexota bacterium]